jgi:hypothetical protein
MVTFHVWAPVGHRITNIEPYLQDYRWKAWATTVHKEALKAGEWNTLNITVPLEYQDKDNVTQATITPLKRLGLRFSTDAAWVGTLYIDSISWNQMNIN